MTYDIRHIADLTVERDRSEGNFWTAACRSCRWEETFSTRDAARQEMAWHRNVNWRELREAADSAIRGLEAEATYQERDPDA